MKHELCSLCLAESGSLKGIDRLVKPRRIPLRDRLLHSLCRLQLIGGRRCAPGLVSAMEGGGCCRRRCCSKRPIQRIEVCAEHALRQGTNQANVERTSSCRFERFVRIRSDGRVGQPDFFCKGFGLFGEGPAQGETNSEEIESQKRLTLDERSVLK